MSQTIVTALIRPVSSSPDREPNTEPLPHSNTMNVAPLYHFTCDHGHDGISKTHILLPNMHPLMKCLGPLVWLTDFAEPPTKESVGLTNSWTTCDRLAYRYIVRCKAAVHWSLVRQRAPKDIVETLESFGQPEHWWVVRRPVLASEFSFDESWRKEVAQ